MIPPLAILPILFIVFGLGELSKVVLIVFGITPVLDARPRSSGRGRSRASSSSRRRRWAPPPGRSSLRVVLPQVLPRLIDALRLSLGAAWLFLIAAEAIAATEGLGYRIFLVRRYLAMDVILPYVVWITLLACAMDCGAGGARTARLVPVVGGQRRMSRRIDVRNLWKEYGDQVVLERINLNVAGRRVLHHRRRLRLRQDHLPAPAARRGAPDARGRSCSTASRCRRAGRRPRRGLPALLGVPAPDRAATTCCSAWNCAAAPLTGRLFGAARGAAARSAPRTCWTRSAWPTPRTSTRRSCPAACSSGWPSPRRW